MQDRAWQDAEVLRELYWDEQMSQPEIADELDCSNSVIDKWMRRHDIPRRDGSLAMSIARGPLNVRTNDRGYEEINARDDGEPVTVLLHRLSAVSKYGFDAVSEAVVHHETGVEWDNRLNNLELLEDSTHKSLHAEERERKNGGQFA
jgi:hypothetical protein